MISTMDIKDFLEIDTKLDIFIIEGVSSAYEPLENTLAFFQKLDDIDYNKIIKNPSTLFIVPLDFSQAANNVLKVNNPRSTYAQVVTRFFENKVIGGIEENSTIAESANVSPDAYIGFNCVIEDGVKIGSGTHIDHNVVIKRNTVIGNNCYVGSNTSLGGPGFGFDVDFDGNPIRIPHLGNLIIGNNVGVGSNVSIARGTIGATQISDFVQIDDCVFIAHNVKIGEGSFIIAGAEISGSVTIGKNVWISPEVTVINKVTIGDNALVGIGSTVTKNIEAGMVAVGSPAKGIKKRYG